ncbi:MAG: hypothetical protein ACOX81_10000 [Candidatus Heteroscillospira sp.]|jgi:hypothetical protein
MRRYILTLIVLVFALSVSAYAAPEMPEKRIGAAHHSDFFVITPDRKLVDWGCDELGLINIGEYDEDYTEDYSSRKTLLEGAVAVEGGYSYIYVIKEDGALYGYGSELFNSFCGLQPRDYWRHVPLYNRETLYATKIMDDVAMVSDGFDCFAALKKDGSVWMWGKNDCGQLGQGYRTEWPDEYLMPVKVMDNCKYVAAGYASFAVTNDGELYWWGGYDDPASWSPRYVCSGVNALNGGMLHMENGDLRWITLYDGVKQIRYDEPQISEPFASNVRRICSTGYLTEDNVLWVPVENSGKFVKALENVDYAFCWPSCCIAITLDGKAYASELYSTEYHKLEYLGPLSDMAEERDYPVNYWPRAFRIKDIVWPILRVLPLML